MDQPLGDGALLGEQRLCLRLTVGLGLLYRTLRPLSDGGETEQVWAEQGASGDEPGTHEELSSSDHFNGEEQSSAEATEDQDFNFEQKIGTYLKQRYRVTSLLGKVKP